MSYSRNFGFRDFTNIIRDGRNKTPSTGNPLVLGTAVVVDASNPGVVKVPAADDGPSALSGVLVYEHIQYKGVDAALTESVDMDTAPVGAYVQIVHGPGVKVWFKNTDAVTLADGRTRDAVTMVAGAGATPTLAVGDLLTVGADGTWKETSTAADAWMVVESIDTDRGLVEARLTF
jgi:hypothetical protein